MTFDSLTNRIRASVDHAIHPVEATEHDDLIRKADLALYEVKNAERGTSRRHEESLPSAARVSPCVAHCR
ncbi:MAG: hypothetical protein U1F34_04970 [Gammaproteobacteria bacterium]